VLPRRRERHRRRRRDSSGDRAPEEHDGHGAQPQMCASVLGWPRGMEGFGGRLGPRPRPAAQARPMCGEGGGGEPLRGRAPRAVLALPAASGPARSRASFPCARASAWNRVALTWARDRGCAAPPQTTASATTARQLWRPRSRRTRRSRRSTSKVRERARVAARDGGVEGRLCPRPRPAAQARPTCGEGERGPLRGRAPRAALALPAASGPVRSRASFPCARASAWNRVALTWARGRGCAAPPQATASAPPARQLWRLRSRRTRRSRRSTSEVRERARVAAGDGGGWGTLGPTAAARRAGAPNVRKRREREPLRGRAPRAALALPAASGPVRSRASFPCARASAWNRVALTWARGRGCAASPQATASAAT
jgi:hypothetical protein